jgi:hypothetical protein
MNRSIEPEVAEEGTRDLSSGMDTSFLLVRTGRAGGGFLFTMNRSFFIF